MATKLLAVLLICTCASFGTADIPVFTGGCGDVNGDGVVQVQDIILTVNLLLNGGESLQADVNNDNTIDVRDVLKMVDWLLNPGTGPTCYGCTDTAGCNYDKSTTVDDGSCSYPADIYPPNGEHFDCDGNCLVDADENGVCDGLESAGCLTDGACNYDVTATKACDNCCVLPGVYQCGSTTACVNDEDGDGTCDENEVLGCTDSNGCNFDSSATDDDDSCTYPEDRYGANKYVDCNGDCVSDVDNDSVCDELEIRGCVYETGCNYNPSATDNDGSCWYAAQYRNCDGNCLSDPDGDDICTEQETHGCTYPEACNYNPLATNDDNTCEFAEDHYDCYGNCSKDTDGDGVCDGLEVVGCTDSSACNFDTLATDGVVSKLCTYNVVNRDCHGDCVVDVDEDDVCDPEEIDGCMDATACNYNASATDEPEGVCVFRTTHRLCDGSCEIDIDDDDVCDGEEVRGCIDNNACNDQSDNATVTEHFVPLCEYPDPHYDCAGACLVDTDGDGHCDDLETPGCTNQSACNYNHLATEDDGSCTNGDPERDCNGFCFSDTDKDNVCDNDEIPGCKDPDGCNYNGDATDHEYSMCEFRTDPLRDCDMVCLDDTDGDNVCDDEEVIGCMDPKGCNYDDEATDNFNCSYPEDRYDCEGKCAAGFLKDCSDDPEDNDCCSETWLDDNYADCKDQKWGCDLSCYDYDNGNCIKHGCANTSACNYDYLVTHHDESTCVYNETNKDCDGNCLNDVDFDEVCDEEEIAGCMNEKACNYDPSATDNTGCEARLTHYWCNKTCINDEDGDEVCDENEIPGCMRPDACNYAPLATDDDGKCSYPTKNYNCGGVCINDDDGDYVCDEDEVLGCQDVSACNYNPLATDNATTIEDGLCRYRLEFLDCDGSCLSDEDNDGVCEGHEIPGCTDKTACNYNLYATENVGCNYAQEHYNCAGECLVDTDGDGTCEDLEVVGCRKEGACNIVADSTEDPPEGSDLACVFPETYYNCDEACINDDDGDGVCNEQEILGCQNSTACNYNDKATDDDPAFPCRYAVEFYDCNGVCEHDEDNDHVCDVFEVVGCRDTNACNYEPLATDDATEEGQKCWYPEFGHDCNTKTTGECASGFVADCSANGKCCPQVWLNDGICDSSSAQNCDLRCHQEEVADCSGCIDPDACNFEEDKVFQDPAEDACNYPLTPFHTCFDRCKKGYVPDCGSDGARCCLEDKLGDGFCNKGQDTSCDLSCYDHDGRDCIGCMDNTGERYSFEGYPASETRGACNYNELATAEPTAPGDPRHCRYPEPYYECDGRCRNDPDEDGVCTELEIEGCLSDGACNISPVATESNEDLCSWPVDHYDCDGNCLHDIDNDKICDVFEIVGCMDVDGDRNPHFEARGACNVQENATDDFGDSCRYPVPAYDCDGNCLLDTDGDGVCDPLEVPGCTDTDGSLNPDLQDGDEARAPCNFKPIATDNDGSCIYPEKYRDCFDNCINDADNDKVCDEDEKEGCMNKKACNYDPDATDPSFTVQCIMPASTKDCDGNCADGFVRDCSEQEKCCLASFIGDNVADCKDSKWGCDLSCYDNDGGMCYKEGCTDETACNFDWLATDDPTDSCKHAPEYYGCDSKCLIDTDGDGVCEENEKTGCQDPVACNFDEFATDAPADASESCVYKEDKYPSLKFDCDGNCLIDTDGDGVCEQDEVAGCMDDSACNYDEAATDDDGRCLVAPDYYRCCVPADNCDDNFGDVALVDSNGDEFLYICKHDVDGDKVCDEKEGKGCKEIRDGIPACNYDETVTDSIDAMCDWWTQYDCDGKCFDDDDNDGVCNVDEVPGCTAINACNYNPAATDSDGSCTYAEQYYTCNPNGDDYCTNDVDNDAVCDELEKAGCNHPDACNFDNTATDLRWSDCEFAADFKDCDGNCLSDSDNDGHCDGLETFGCTDQTACNFDSDATELDVTACDFPDTYLNCQGGCLNDEDEDGVCDEFEVRGCTDPNSCTPDADATDDDGSCSYPQTHLDCQDNCLADTDGDGVCDPLEKVGCRDSEACNYDSDATDDGECTYPDETYLDCDGNCLHNADGDDYCDEVEIPGCTTVGSCNYDSNATDADGSCTHPLEDYLDCDQNCLHDTDGDGVCNEIEEEGCMEPAETGKLVCTLSETATDHKESDCVYAEEYFDCDGNCLFDGNYDGICDHQEVPGCNIKSACNYNSSATQYDGNCEWPPTYYDCDGNCRHDQDGDKVCDDLEILGCMSNRSCNYDPLATDDHGCVFATPLYTCDGECEFDKDGDKVCDHEERVGCMKWDACNFDVLATDPSPNPDGHPGEAPVGCIFPRTYYECDGSCTTDVDKDGVCDEIETYGCRDTESCNFMTSATEHQASACVYPDETYLDCDGNCLHDSDEDGECDEVEVSGCTLPDHCNYDPAATHNHGCITTPEKYECDNEEGYHCIGTTCYRCIDDEDGDEICDADERLGCQDSAACNYDALATDSDPNCRYPPSDYRTCLNECKNDRDGDGVCDEEERPGCMEASACNFDKHATDPLSDYCVYAKPWRNCHDVCYSDKDLDGVCDMEEQHGCLDTTACNYNASITEHHEDLCEYPPAHYTCDGCINDQDQDGVCDEHEVRGCMDATACNQDASATDPPGEGDEPCRYAEQFKNCAGECMAGYIQDCAGTHCCSESWLGGPYKDCKDAAYNCDLSCYDYDNGACIKYGCNRQTACNYDYLVTHQEPNSCIWPEEHRNCDGTCKNDTNANGICDPLEFGCKEETACNTNMDALYHVPEDCVYADGVYDCDGNCKVDTDRDGVCEENEVAGCDDATACNHDEGATENDGSCQYAPDHRNCTGDCYKDENNDGVCDEEEVWGCSYTDACNFDPNITMIDNDLCDYPKEEWLDCDDNCLIDTDGDGVCNSQEKKGCFDPGACNFDPEVTDPNNNMCHFSEDCKGCTDPEACNYNPDAKPHLDDGTYCLPMIDHRICNEDGTYGDCEQGYLSDCSGNNQCVPASYLNDGYPDCGWTPGGWDLTCHGETGC